ncbi:MAG: hypothetical protein J6X03_02565, partial [Bacilli bacterium]|nr:hypothetical protein [Bacilli bacterium]
LNVGFKIGLELITTFRLSAILVGILILLLFVVLKFFFVLFVVDALFKLNFSIYLLPILIMGIPFNFTRKWSKYGLLMFVNSSGVMLFLGILVSVAIVALEMTVGSLTELGYSSFEGFGISLLTIVLISFLFINIPGMGAALSDKFIGGGRDLEFQKKISKFIINSIKKGGAKILGSLTAGTSTTMTNAWEKHEKYREMITNLKVKQSNLSNAINSLEGYNED